MEERTFDLVLMDIQMPVMSGLEAVTAIREKEKGSGRHVTVIALSALAMNAEYDTIMGMGFDGYLAKPVEFEALFAQIRRCLPDDLRSAGTGKVAPPLAVQASVSSQPVFDREEVALLLDEIEAMLQNGNMVVIDKTVQLTRVVPETKIVETFRHFVRRYDFDGALTCLAQIRNEFNITKKDL